MSTQNTQIIDQPTLYAYGLQVSNNATTPNTKLDVAAGRARDSSNKYDIIVSSALTLDASVNGVNGLDTGDLAASTWYYLFVIGDSSNYNTAKTLLSTSASPLLPTGYDVFRRIGFALTDGSSHFLVYTVVGNGNMRYYEWDAVATELSAAANTSFTDVDLSSSVAPTSQLVNINWKLVPATAGNLSNLRKKGSSSTTNVQLTGSVASQPNTGSITVTTNTSQVIQYKTANGSDALTLYVAGFTDFI